MTRTLSCGAVIYRKVQGRVVFLLLKHANGSHWSLAKGHTEPGRNRGADRAQGNRRRDGAEGEAETRFSEAIRYSPSTGVEKTVVFFLAKARGKRLNCRNPKF